MTAPVRLTLSPLGLTEPAAWEFELRRGEQWIGHGTAPSPRAAIDAAERMRTEYQAERGIVAPVPNELESDAKPTCDRCRYWLTTERDEREFPGRAPCFRIAQVTRTRDSALLIYTMAGFGCAAFEAKET